MGKKKTKRFLKKSKMLRFKHPLKLYPIFSTSLKKERSHGLGGGKKRKREGEEQLGRHSGWQIGQ